MLQEFPSKHRITHTSKLNGDIAHKTIDPQRCRCFKHVYEVNVQAAEDVDGPEMFMKLHDDLLLH